MLKNAYFFRKKQCKIASASGAPPPELPFAFDGWELRPPTPHYYSGLLLLLCRSSFLALKFVLLPLKKNNFCIFPTFAPIFNFELCRFCWQKAQKYFLVQGTRYPSYATDFTSSISKLFLQIFLNDIFPKTKLLVDKINRKASRYFHIIFNDVTR